MLAEIFMLRLEARRQAAPAPAPQTPEPRFVPYVPAR
jgi:hypothetical protein